MANEIDVVFGNRVYLEMPRETKSDIILDEATQASVDQNNMKKWSRMKVFAVGDGVTGLKAGDYVMIDPSRPSDVVKVPVEGNKEVLMISMFNIAHKWK